MLKFDALLKQLGVSPSHPASDAEIEAFETQAGLKLTPELKQLYKTTNGLVLKKNRLEILPLAQVLVIIQALSEGYTAAPRLGYFPLTETFDSDFICVCSNDLLRGYVVHVPHDDVPSLMFRELNNFFGAILETVQKSDWDWIMNDLPTDFENDMRTEIDTTVARNLLAVGLKNDAEDSAEVLSFALVLSSENQLYELIPLLKFPDGTVRRDAAKRIGQMEIPEAKAALESDKKDFHGFIVRSADLLRNGGLRATVHERPQLEDTICLDDGPVWLNMDAFYSHSLGSGAFGDKPVEAVLLERAKYFLDQKQKNK